MLLHGWDRQFPWSFLLGYSIAFIVICLHNETFPYSWSAVDWASVTWEDIWQMRLRHCIVGRTQNYGCCLNSAESSKVLVTFGVIRWHLLLALRKGFCLWKWVYRWWLMLTWSPVVIVGWLQRSLHVMRIQTPHTITRSEELHLRFEYFVHHRRQFSYLS